MRPKRTKQQLQHQNTILRFSRDQPAQAAGRQLGTKDSRFLTYQFMIIPLKERERKNTKRSPVPKQRLAEPVGVLRDSRQAAQARRNGCKKNAAKQPRELQDLRYLRRKERIAHNRILTQATCTKSPQLREAMLFRIPNKPALSERKPRWNRTR